MHLRQQTFKSLVWNLTDNFAVQVIQFVTGIYMARILSPSDYGLMGMLLIFTALSDAIMNGGFSTALIRKNDRTDVDMSTVFYFNIVISLFLYGILFLSAPWIADFYKVPLLKDLVKVAAIPFVLNAFCLVQRTYFIIQMDFKTQAKYSVVSTLVKEGSGIYMAYSGYGVWAIAWSGVFGTVTTCLLYWWNSVWRPRLQFSLQSFRELFAFGSKLMLSSILDVAGNNLFTIIIGKRFAPASLGYYTRAFGYASLPANILSGVLSRVTLPMLSKIQDDDEYLSDVYQRLLNLSAFITFPLMTGLSLLSYPLITLMLTERWAPSAEYLQILCFMFMLYPIHSLNLNLLQVKGRSDLFLRLEFVKKALMLIMLFVTVPMGILFICVGGGVCSFISWGINAYYTGKIIQVGFIRQLVNMLPIVGYTLFMSLCVYVVNNNIPNYGLKLLLGFIVGILSYTFISYCFHSSELKFIIQLMTRAK